MTSAVVGNVTYSAINNSIVLGTSDSANRVGRQTWMRSVEIRGSLKANSGATLQQGFIALIYDHSPRGAVTAYGDVFVAGTQYYGAPNESTRDRFEILDLWDFTIAGSSTVLNDSGVVIVDRKIDCELRPTLYMETAGSSNSIATGGFHIQLWTDGNSGFNQNCIFNGIITLRYFDTPQE